MSLRVQMARLDAAVADLPDDERARCVQFLRGLMAFVHRENAIPDKVGAALVDVVMAAGTAWALKGTERVRAQVKDALAAAPTLAAVLRDLVP